MSMQSNACTIELSLGTIYNLQLRNQLIKTSQKAVYFYNFLYNWEYL